jgi:hypothetical protein
MLPQILRISLSSSYQALHYPFRFPPPTPEHTNAWPVSFSLSEGMWIPNVKEFISGYNEATEVFDNETIYTTEKDYSDLQSDESNISDIDFCGLWTNLMPHYSHETFPGEYNFSYILKMFCNKKEGFVKYSLSPWYCEARTPPSICDNEVKMEYDKDYLHPLRFHTVIPVFPFGVPYKEVFEIIADETEYNYPMINAAPLLDYGYNHFYHHVWTEFRILSTGCIIGVLRNLSLANLV